MTRITESAQIAAEQYGVDIADVVALMADAHCQLMAERELTEPARIRACYLTRLNAKRCNLWEDAGFDYSTRPGFDCYARTVAFEHPELGLDPRDDSASPAVWELIKRGPLPRLAKSSAEVADLAAQWASRFNSHYAEFTEWSDDDLDESEFIDADCSFNPDEFGDPVTMEIVADTVAEETITPVAEESLTDPVPGEIQPLAVETEATIANPGYHLRLRTQIILPHKRRYGGLQSVCRHSISPPMPPVRYDPKAYLVDGSHCRGCYHSRGHPSRRNPGRHHNPPSKETTDLKAKPCKNSSCRAPTSHPPRSLVLRSVLPAVQTRHPFPGKSRQVAARRSGSCCICSHPPRSSLTSCTGLDRNWGERNPSMMLLSG